MGKKEKIKDLVFDMLNESHEQMLKRVEKILNSSSIDIESWDEKNNPMILPKSIIVALLQNESDQYNGKGTKFEKEIKQNVKNIIYVI